MEHESKIHTDAPLPSQLHKLATIGMGSAANRESLKQLQRTPRAYFSIDEYDSYTINELTGDAMQLRHKMAVRMGASMNRNFGKIWSLKYYDVFWVGNEDDEWTAERTLHEFKWNRQRALLARRTFRLISDTKSTRDKDMYDEIDQFHAPDDISSEWHMRLQMEQITKQDCELLIDRSSDYFSTVDHLYVNN